LTEQEKKIGVACAISAYLIWGFAPIYFKQLLFITPQEILVNRIVWSVLILGALLAVLGHGRKLKAALADLKTLPILVISSTLLAFNWFLFIWAVNNDQMLEASLGYYINPLLNMLLGYIFLKERLDSSQKLAVLLALTGVCYLVISVGESPWIALALASSFSIYGLLRKVISVESITGLFLESAIMAPVAIIYWTLHPSETSNLLNNTVGLNTLLISAGIITTAPLLFFTMAARRINYSTLGFVQFIAPTLMFLLAVVIYQEPLDPSRVVTFAFVWSGLLIYVYSAYRRYRNLKITRPV